MSPMPIRWASGQPPSPSDVAPLWLRIASAVLRTIFIALLLVATIHVSMPQNETIWTVYDTPGDLARLVLGLAICVWLAAQFFIAPKDARSQRTWLYLGLAAVPFAAICIIAVW